MHARVNTVAALTAPSQSCQVWKEGTEEGNVWKVAALNRRHAAMQQPAKAQRESALTLPVSGTGTTYRDGGGGGGGLQLAERQAENADPGPVQYEEAPSSYEQEEDEKDRQQALREAARNRKREAARRMRDTELRRQQDERVRVPDTELA